MYRVAYDRTANILNLSVAGFFAPEDVAGLSAQVLARGREAQAIRGDFDVVVESFDFPVQANDVADLLAGVMTIGLPLTTGRVAVIVGSNLNKLQAERTLVDPRVKVVRTLDEAEQWLAREAREAIAG